MTTVLPIHLRRIDQFNRRKRLFDVVLLCLSLGFTGPVLVILSILCWRQQGRPVLFRQKRLGYRSKPFYILKFRTMTLEQDSDGFLLPDEQRLTMIGSFLRRTSLDELPQIVNVLRGEMAIVGPRPLYPQYEGSYTPREAIRHLVRPGITGYAQVNGRNLIGWDARLEYDALYVERASLLLDFRILLGTVVRVIRRSEVTTTPGTSGGRHLHMYRGFPGDEMWRLRLLEQGDLAERVAWLNHSGTRDHMSVVGTITLPSTEKWFDSHRKNPAKHDFAVVHVTTNDVVAMVGLTDTGDREAESYVMVNPRLRGQGIGLHAQRLLYQWAFTHRGYKTVRSSVAKANVASVKIHVRLGAHPESETELRYVLIATPEQFWRATEQAVGIRPIQ
jgi:undecaprenyl phosphate N,N'-diacetylbacillosamine 1-phosphate transferase